ncbi:MAG: hypothetical protein ACREPA_06775 [Candidatus Dormibacteraceae bacterium]
MSEIDEFQGWFAGRIPDGWFTGAPEVTADREEILVVGTLPEAEVGKDATDAVRAGARQARIDGFRQDTRERRMRLAAEAEHRFQRKVSWGAVCGDVRRLFTIQSLPVMTRLRMPERAVLDTLVNAGVARSRSDALGWCVRLVGENQSAWIDRLREALTTVERARAEGPG